MTHIIKKQILEFTLNEGERRHALQEDLVLKFYEQLLPAMAKVFDDMAPAKINWKIDRLEIDVGKINPDDLKKAVVLQLEKELQKRLAKTAALKPDQSEQLISPEKSLLLQFLYFLKYGHFAWNSVEMSFSKMEEELAMALLVLEKDFQAELLHTLTFYHSQYRLRMQFSEHFQLALASGLLPLGEMAHLLKFLRNQVPESLVRILPILALFAFAENRNEDEAGFIARLLWKIEKELQLTQPEKTKFHQQLLFNVIHENQPFKEALTEALKKDQSFEHTKPENQEIGTDDTIYIANAGMVLLWPYLQRFFENRELVRNGSFVSRPAREKAILLLQHLTDPEVRITENQLPLNKILCGMDLHDVVPTKAENNVRISRAEDLDCRELLKAVISNWRKIKKTSVKGFQTSFLQREGRLQKNNDEWTLKVEQRSFDLLMDSLPWSITLIKLPWMPKPLHVEW